MKIPEYVAQYMQTTPQTTPQQGLIFQKAKQDLGAPLFGNFFSRWPDLFLNPKFQPKNPKKKHETPLTVVNYSYGPPTC